MRTARRTVAVTVTRYARQHSPKRISSLGVCSRAAPAEKARIRIMEARIQRMTKYAVRIRLPDFEDRVQDRPIAFLQHAPRQQDMLAPRLFSLKAGQVLAPEIGRAHV